MIKTVLRWTKGIALLLAIVVFAGAVGIAHYSYQRGRAPDLPTRSAGILDEGKSLVQQGTAAVEKLASRVSNEFAPQAGKSESSDGTVQDEGDIQVYFAPCRPWNPLGIESAFIRFLDSAKKSIYGAFYDLELPDAARALIAKRQAGVDVRIVSDSNYRDRDAIRSCIAAGIPVVFDEREGFMHDKFCIVDDTRVWTGSTNVTENCMYRNDNNSLLIASPKLAADFTAEFEEMFTDHRFGKGSSPQSPYPEVVLADARIECLFAPEDDVRHAIVREIDQSDASIDFMAFAFTSSPIAKAMAARIPKGVKVRGLFDIQQAKQDASQDEYLAAQGAQVLFDRNDGFMHNKVIIIDRETVITGSYNFTKAAETRNDENVLIVHAPWLAGKYENEFESLLPR